MVVTDSRHTPSDRRFIPYVSSGSQAAVRWLDGHGRSTFGNERIVLRRAYPEAGGDLAFGQASGLCMPLNLLRSDQPIYLDKSAQLFLPQKAN